MNNKTFVLVIAIMGIVGFVAITSYLPTRFEKEGKVKIAGAYYDIETGKVEFIN